MESWKIGYTVKSDKFLSAFPVNSNRTQGLTLAGVSLYGAFFSSKTSALWENTQRSLLINERAAEKVNFYRKKIIQKVQSVSKTVLCCYISDQCNL